jgi:hypothetical protein
VPIDLLDEHDWRRAIESKHLRRESPVKVYRDDERPRATRAGEVPELAAIFDEIDPQPAAPPPSRLVSHTEWRRVDAA